jgi:hypothetical protein
VSVGSMATSTSPTLRRCDRVGVSQVAAIRLDR